MTTTEICSNCTELEDNDFLNSLIYAGQRFEHIEDFDCTNEEFWQETTHALVGGFINQFTVKDDIVGEAELRVHAAKLLLRAVQEAVEIYGDEFRSN